MLCEDGYYRKVNSVGTGGTGCSSCADDGDVVATTMIFLVIILIMLALFFFGQSCMEDAFRALGWAVQVDPMKPMRCNRLVLSA